MDSENQSTVYVESEKLTIMLSYNSKRPSTLRTMLRGMKWNEKR